MDKLTKKLIGENVEMKSLLGWFFQYAEKGEDEDGGVQFTFPDVVVILSEDEYNNMRNILK